MLKWVTHTHVKCLYGTQFTFIWWLPWALYFSDENIYICYWSRWLEYYKIYMLCRELLWVNTSRINRQVRHSTMTAKCGVVLEQRKGGVAVFCAFFHSQIKGKWIDRDHHVGPASWCVQMAQVHTRNAACIKLIVATCYIDLTNGLCGTSRIQNIL